MRYKGFYIEIIPKEVIRVTASGESVLQAGFLIQILDSMDRTTVIDCFTLAEGFEILKNNPEEAEQFAKDYINTEEKELCRLLDEYHNLEKE
ncbi:MAG: hypothetical protein IJJ69_07565 [Oscillospiraceae bacterium]|nr:hypothetical protein [Oscillospiraceae bacterium]